MAVKEGMFRQIANFIGEDEIDKDWFLNHMTVTCDDSTKTVTITIDNMNEQEYEWVKEEL